MITMHQTRISSSKSSGRFHNREGFLREANKLASFSALCASITLFSASMGTGVLAASYTVSSRADFNAAIGFGPTTTETFDGSTANSPVIDFGDFRTTISDPDGATQHRKLGDRYLIQLDGEGSPVDTLATMEFDDPIFGFGFDNHGFDLVDVSVDGGVTWFDIFTESGSTGLGFFGVVSDVSFTTVLFDIVGSANGDGGLMDDLVYTTGPVPSVPLPGTGMLLLAGLCGTGLWRRSKLQRP